MLKRIIVCVKPVPDPKEWKNISLDENTLTLKREAVSHILNPLDRNAIEEALKLKGQTGAEVVLISMAPERYKELLREGLAMGADRGYLLSDPEFAGSDTLATAQVISSACKKIGDFDLILCGNQTIDGSTSQVPSQLGEFLRIPSIMHVQKIDLRDGLFYIWQRLGHRIITWESPSPLLVSVRGEINRPRYVTFKGILEAENKEIIVWDNNDLPTDPSLIGLNGSPTKMKGLKIKRYKREKRRLEGDKKDIVKEVVEKIYELQLI